MITEIKRISDEVSIMIEMAKEKRRELNLGNAPIGDTIFKILKDKNINLFYIPIMDNGNVFSSVYVLFEEMNFRGSFIGLNTNDYYDNQIFSLALQLYYFYNNAQMHICKRIDDNLYTEEIKAYKFAEEFLLPFEVLETEVKNFTRGLLDLNNFKHNRLLRFVIKLYCEYKLPYDVIIKKLLDFKFINDNQFNILKKESIRNIKSYYSHKGLFYNSSIFKSLNLKTLKKGMDLDNFEVVIDNYENNIISLTEFIETIELFDIDRSILNINDLEEMAEMFEVQK